MQPDGIAADREIRLENCQLVQSARAEGTSCEMICFAGIAVACALSLNSKNQACNAHLLSTAKHVFLKFCLLL